MTQAAEDITIYQQQARAGAIDPFPYDRLMIYYRKQKEYKKELQLINRALKVFGDHFKKQTAAVLQTARSQAAIKRLSEKISRSSGLIDKQGKPNYIPEPLLRWTKRKQMVEAKLKR